MQLEQAGTASVNRMESHPDPLRRFFSLLSQEKKDIAVLTIYTLINGLLSLSVPLAAQSLVNTIAAGIFLQPLIVLSLLLLSGLLFVSVLRMLNFCIVENMQQRIFARVSMYLSQRIPAIKLESLKNEYMPELINRFFETIIIQKSWGKLLLEVPSALLQVLVGLLLMAFYSPLLLAFDLCIIAFVLFATGVLGLGGLRTSIQESVAKYKVAEWLEDMGRCQSSLKTNGGFTYLLARSDELVMSYIDGRRRHFSILYRQAFGTYVFQALASTGILAIGGWLVINRELTLGQLVAAELVVLSVLTALEKLIRSCETFYDLLTGLNKIGHLVDLPVERSDGMELPQGSDGLSVVCRQIHFSYDPKVEILRGLDLAIESGEKASLVGASGAGKSTLASIICGLLDPSHGTVEVGAFDTRDLSLRSLRKSVGIVGDANEIFEGSIEENVSLGRSSVTHKDLRWALDIAQFSDDLIRMPEGLRTKLVSGGRNLSRGQMQRLLIARAIVSRPRLLILDEAFTGIDEKTKLKIVDAIFSPEQIWTILDISHDAEVVMRSSIVYALSGGTIVESGTPRDLAWRADSEFSTLFPELAAQIRQVERRSKEMAGSN